jgi:hypothetical protein
MRRSEPQLNMSSMTGRPRKLSDGAMLDICDRFRQGDKVSDLAEMFSVSEHTIYSICYWTPRDGGAQSPEENFDQ